MFFSSLPKSIWKRPWTTTEAKSNLHHSSASWYVWLKFTLPVVKKIFEKIPIIFHSFGIISKRNRLYMSMLWKWVSFNKECLVPSKGRYEEIKNVLVHVKNYYENLYTCFDSNLVDVDLRNVLYFNTPKLDKQLASGLEKDITEAEVLTVVKQMKNNQFPGSDGYTAEFYNFFLKRHKTLYLFLIIHSVCVCMSVCLWMLLFVCLYIFKKKKLNMFKRDHQKANKRRS